MSIFAQATRAFCKRTSPTSIAARRAATTVQTSTIASKGATTPITANGKYIPQLPFTPRPEQSKSWISRFIKPPDRPITAGEYAFVQGSKTAAVTLAAGAYISGAVYITVVKPCSKPRVLALMSQMSEEDAARLWKREMDGENFMPRSLY
jgi:hypothetical protein